MIAVEGTIRGGRVVSDGNLDAYEGRSVIVTVLDDASSGVRREPNIDRYVRRTERGQHVDEYLREMREDR